MIIKTRPILRMCGRLLVLMVALATTSISTGATVTLRVPKIEAKAGGEIEVPVEVERAKGMSALQALLTYDPAVLEVVQEPDDPDATLTRGKILPENAIAKVYTTTPGRLPILFLGGVDVNHKTVFVVEEDGTLLTVRFRVVGNPGQKTAMNLEKAEAFQASDIDMLVKTEPGELTVTRGLPWWWWVALIPIVLLLLATLVRRRNRARKASAKDEPELVAVPLDAPVRHTCVKCRRVITVPTSLGGKMFKCPNCGTPQAAGV